MSFTISKWFNNHQAPSVLMIDDLSDAYINTYKEAYKNDWGYLCKEENSVYSFLEKELLNKFPSIKITFFVPYLKHNVISENGKKSYKKHGVGERIEFSDFLKYLIKEGHEIAHHGSNHGQYIDTSNPSTVNNFKHEWELFENVDEGVEVTKKGIETFKEHLNVEIKGGKFCGYKQRENSLEIIDKSKFDYWCEDVNYNTKNYTATKFGEENIISFPTNLSGNAFVRLSYITGDKQKDRKKQFTKYLQPLYDIAQYRALNNLYTSGNIISIQEHISPATSSGITQSANIVSDITSLQKIYNYLSNKSIWYATCQDIADYIYAVENTDIYIDNEEIVLKFNNYKNLKNITISINDKEYFEFFSQEKHYVSKKNNHKYTVNIPIVNGENRYRVERERKL